MNSQFGLMHVWTQGDWVTRGVFLALVSMSVLSWIVIVIKALDIMRAKRQAARVESFWHSSDMAEALGKLGNEPGNPFRELTIEGREAAAHHRATRAQLHDSLDVSDWILSALRNSIDVATARMQAGLAVLASVGSTAPFVGLFGTVWGIYHALMSIGAAGQASIDKVAGPIGEALIMTALGLAVAIPAVLGYNALVRGNKHILVKLNRFAHDLHAYYVTGARVTTAAADGNVVRMKKA
ncbi:MotA/TolQ/ExbB proton channel family protein [Comamonadaceae bacterium OH2545_COT-014]|nr:MotA/TolQ/ExbB proton channel family protein [Comamonadaceae bacterium OH2545_COT-014]